MSRIELWWNAFPACIYEYLLKFKGTDSYHNPILGTGVYAFVHANGHRYQVYYVGKSMDIGNRLYQHYLKYAGEDVSDYWLPYKAELFNGDIYKIFNQDPTGEKYFKREGEGFTKEQRIEVGKQIMHGTYFAFARVSEDYIEKVEAVLHYAILKKNNVGKYGWLGEKNSLLPNEDIVIKNIYHNDVIKRMLLPSIPEEIIILNGEMKFDSLSMQGKYGGMFVGIFYYIDGKIINETVELNYAENYGDFKIYKGSHFDMWRKVLEKKTNKPYDYFPRGRVVYNYNEGYFRMFIDKCINKPETIAEIKQVFGIKDEKIELIDNDLHYVCNRCNRYFKE